MKNTIILATAIVVAAIAFGTLSNKPAQAQGYTSKPDPAAACACNATHCCCAGGGITLMMCQ